MAFSQSSSSSALSATPNITPLIDVLLVLLIIFMVIVPVNPRGLRALVPEPSPDASAASSVPVVLHVLPGAGSGASYRMGDETLNEAGLLARLREISTHMAGPQLVIEGDARLDYHPIANAVATAHLAGFHEVGLAQEPLR